MFIWIATVMGKLIVGIQGGRFSLQVFIPNDIDGLEDFLRALQSTELNEILRKIRKTDHCDSVDLRLPKFKIESTLNLVGPLKQVRPGIEVYFPWNKVYNNTDDL